MTLPVVRTPEANEDLLEARAWYDNIRPELGSVSPGQSKPRLNQSLNIHGNFLSSTGIFAALGCGAFRIAYSSSCKKIGSW